MPKQTSLTSSSGPSLMTGTRSGLLARPWVVSYCPADDDSEPAEERPPKRKKPRIATTSKRTTAKSKRKHDDSEDDSDNDDPPPSKKRKCGRWSPEKSSYLCSDCGSGDGQQATGSTPINDHHDAKTTTPSGLHTTTNDGSKEWEQTLSNCYARHRAYAPDITKLFKENTPYIEILLLLEELVTHFRTTYVGI